MIVSIIAAATVCGRIGPGFKGSAVDREFLLEMRGSTGASILGAGTLRFQDVSMESGSDNRFRCIISSSGIIPIYERELFFSRPSVIFTGREGANRIKASLPENSTLILISEYEKGVLNLCDAVKWLADRGVDSVLVEGGGMLNYEAVRQRVASELMLTLCPTVSGMKRGQSILDGPKELRSLCTGLDLQDLRYSPGSQEVFLRYRFIYSNTSDFQEGYYA